MAHPKIYAFIDSQNLNLGILSCGWKLDFRKFHIYLKDKYKVIKVFLFIGYIIENEKLYRALRKAGFILIFKPTISQFGKMKGNVDAELVLHAMIEYNNYTKAIIVSGDGDFHCLIEYLDKKNKLLYVLIPSPNSYSALLRRFRKYFIYINNLEKKLVKKKERE